MKTFCILFSFLLTGNVFAKDLSLRSLDGFGVQVTYEIQHLDNHSNKPALSDIAANVEFSVSAASVPFHSFDQVRLVLVSTTDRQMQCGFPNGTNRDVYRIDLKYDA